MHLLTKTLQSGTSISNLFSGIFSTNYFIDIIITRDSFIEILKIKKNGKLILINCINLFKVIFSGNLLNSFKLRKDFILIIDARKNINIIGINSKNKAYLLSFRNTQNLFFKKKSSCFIYSINTKTLTCLVSYSERQKIIFLFRIDQIGSPRIFKNYLEIKQSHRICYNIVSLNSFYETIFVCIETFNKKPYDKFLVFYYTDLKSKIVKQKIISRIHSSSYLLIPLSENFCKGDCLLVISKNCITFVNQNKNIIVHKKYPLLLTLKEGKHYVISSYAYFKGKKKDFILVATKEGCLFKLYFSKVHPKNNLFPQIKIKYFETLTTEVKSMIILSNGFLFTNMESGNHCYFQFINTGKEMKRNQNKFLPRHSFINIHLVDEFISLSQVLGVEIDNNLYEHPCHFFVLCGTGVNSSVRLLRRTHYFKRIQKKKLKNQPNGLFFIITEFFLIYIMVSFDTFSVSYILNEKFEEANDTFLINDFPTLSMKYFKPRKCLTQITKKRIRNISFLEEKMIINDWSNKYSISIINSTTLISQTLYLVLLFENKKILFLEILHDGFLLELMILTIATNKIYSIKGVSIKFKKLTKISFLIFFSREEKILKIYKINPNFSLSLNTIQLLPWVPESVVFFGFENMNYLLISLNNGRVIKILLELEKGQLSNIKSSSISKNPIYIFPKEGGFDNFIIGPKIWNINFFDRDLKSDIFLNQNIDFFGFSRNFYICVKKKKLKIFFFKPNFLNFSKIYCSKMFWTPSDFSLIFSKIKTKIALVAFSQKNSYYIHHNFFLMKYKKNKFTGIQLKKNSKKNFTSGLMLENFFEKPKKISPRIKDFIIFRGSTKNRFINSLSIKKAKKNKRFIVLVSIDNFSNGPLCPKSLNLIEEKKNNLYSLLFFFLKKSLVFSSKKGGRVFFKYKLEFIRENLFFNTKETFFLCKKVFGHRFILKKGEFLEFFEVTKNGSKSIIKFKYSVSIKKNIDFFCNRIYVTSLLSGLKVFELKTLLKKFFLLGEKKNLLFCFYLKVIDLSTFLVVDIFGIFYSIRCKIKKPTHFFDILEKKKMTLVILSKIKFNFYPSKLIIIEDSKKTKEKIFAINNEGTITNIITISSHKYIYFLVTLKCYFDFLNLKICKLKNYNKMYEKAKFFNIINENFYSTLSNIILLKTQQ